MKQKATHTFEGGIDSDASLYDVRPGDFIEALNIRNSHGETKRIITNVKGNEENTGIPLPSGTNKVVGTFEDKRRNTLFVLVWNNGNDHHVIRWFPDEVNEFKIVGRGSSLGFSQDRFVSGIRLIDDRYLIWTDARVAKESISGVPPKMLDILYGEEHLTKSFTYEIIADDLSGTASNTYTVEVVNIDGSQTLAPTLFYTSTGWVGNPGGLINQLRLGLAGVSGNFQMEQCGNYLLVNWAVNGNKIIVTSSAGDIMHVATNSYPDDQTDYISLIKKMPTCAPDPLYKINSSITESKLFNFTFKFQYRFVFWDNSKSPWSPISTVPTNWGPGETFRPAYASPTTEYNEIEVSLPGTLLTDEKWRTFIRKVELGVRFDDDGPLHIADTVDIRALPLSPKILFYNTSAFSVAPSDDSTTSDTQALKPHDYVPRLASSLEVVSDDEGNTFAVLGGCLENYDQVDCSQVFITPSDSVEPLTPYPSDQDSVLFFKRGGEYNLAVHYEDDFGRRTPATFIGRLKIPFAAEVSAGNWGWAAPITSIILNYDPPQWANRYRLLRTKNQNQGTYVQIPAMENDYFIITDNSDEPTSTVFGDTDATHIVFTFSIDAIPSGNDQNIATLFFDEQGGNAILVDRGDRIQITEFLGVPGLVGQDLNDYNWPIAGYWIETSAGSSPIVRYHVLIDYDQTLPNFQIDPGGYIFCEIYRPKSVEENIYYEMAECYLTVFSGGRYIHQASHDISEFGDTAVTGTNKYHQLFQGTGDTVFAVPFKERADYYPFKASPIQNIGRPNIEDTTFKERFYFDQMRVSDIYVPDSQLNGLGSFRSLEYTRVGQQYGALTKLQVAGEVLLAICQFKVQPYYVSADSVLAVSGENTLVRTETLLNRGHAYKDSFGTRRPESVVEEDGHVWGFDDHRGVVWRASSNGLFPVSNYGLIKEIYQEGRNFYDKDFTNNFAIGAFQREFSIYYLTLLNQGYSKTIGFTDVAGQESRWKGAYSFTPEAYGQLGLNFLSFSDGRMWLHEQGDYCNFYGTQYNCQIKFVCNSLSELRKVFWSMHVIASKKWYASAITIPASESFPNGMSSRIPASYFVPVDGGYHADFLRDQTDPHTVFTDIVDPAEEEATALLRGRQLKGYLLTCTMQALDPSIENELKRLDISFTITQRTQ